MLRLDGRTTCRKRFGFAVWIMDGTSLELPQDISPASVQEVMDCHGVSWCASALPSYLPTLSLIQHVNTLDHFTAH